MTIKASQLELPRIALNAALVYLGTLASLALGFIIKILLTRVLSPLDLGLLFTGQMIVEMGQTLARLSLPDAVARFVGLYAVDAMGRAKRVLLDALTINLGAAAFTVVVLVAGARYVANVLYGRPELSWVLVWLAVVLPLVTFAEILVAASRGLGQMWIKVACMDLARPLWVILAVGALLAAGVNSLPSVVVVHASWPVVVSVLTVVAFRRDPRWSCLPEGDSKGEILRYSLPLLANGFATWPSMLIPLLLGSLVSPEAVSFFNLSSALSTFIYMPVVAVEFAILPVWTRLIAQGNRAEMKRLYIQTTRWCFVLGSVVFALLFLCPQLVLGSIYGSAYVEGARVLQVVSLTFMAGAITGPNNSLLYAFGHTRQILFATTVGGAVALVGAYPSILAWGLTGGLMIFALTQVIGFALYAIVLFRAEGVHPLHSNHLRTLFATGCALTAVALMRGALGTDLFGAATLLGLYITLLFGALFALRVFDADDSELVRRLLAAPGALLRMRGTA